MPMRAAFSIQARMAVAVILGFATASLGCREAEPTTTPTVERRPSPAPVLSADDEALLASLIADDPGDFHLSRARVWRLGSARWRSDGPDLANHPGNGELAHPLEVVIVDRNGPRVLLPLEELSTRPTGPEDTSEPPWSALRIVAVLSPGDLVAGLTRELAPTPWLTLAAGVHLTPRGRTDDHLDVRWSDPACGFGLELVLDLDDFGPLYEPGPTGPPTDPPGPPDADARRLAPGTKIYSDLAARTPVLELDPEPPSHGDRMRAAQRLTLEGKPSKGRQAITLTCRGVALRGFVESKAIVAGSASYSVVENAPSRESSCAGHEGEMTMVPRATPLYEPAGDGVGVLVGVVAQDVELSAAPGLDGWWTACVGSPWGDMTFRFSLR
jgi:hypothetical protein